MTALALRPVRADDWTRIHEWASSLEACRYQPWGPNEPPDTRSFVSEALLAWDGGTTARRVYAADVHGPGVVGVGELKIPNLAQGQAEIGYTVHPALWGRGFATAIARELVAIARNEGMHRVFGTCDPRNQASSEVLRKVGMQYEGTMRHTMRIRDGWRDSEVYALILEEG